MSHIIYPETVLGQKELLASINEKHTADALTSPLNEYIKENNFDIDQAILDGVQAETIDKSRVLLTKQGSNYTELRDLQLHPVFSRLKGEVQFIKSLYKNNPKELGNWGITVEGKAKIVYPINFEGKVITANNFFEKHLSYPAGTSPLAPFITKNKIDITEDKAMLVSAVDFNDKAITTAQLAESKTQLKNALWNPTVVQLKGIGKYLMSLYVDNAKGLVAYGFIVDNSVAKPKIVNTTIKLLDKTTLKGLVIGGTLTNEGTEDIHLYKGTTTTGNPIVIKPGEKYGIAKGFSAVTISNPSTLITAKVSALRIK